MILYFHTFPYGVVTGLYRKGNFPEATTTIRSLAAVDFNVVNNADALPPCDSEPHLPTYGTDLGCFEAITSSMSETPMLFIVRNMYTNYSCSSSLNP